MIEGLPGRPLRPPLVPAVNTTAGVSRYLRFESESAEADGVARIVRWLVEHNGVAPEDIVVLFRSNHNNAWSRPLTEALQNFSVPVVNPHAVDEMLSQSSNRRLLAYARLIVNPKDSLAWWTILDLTNGIGPRARDHFYEGACAAGVTFGDQVLSEFKDDFCQLSYGRPLVMNTVRPVIDLTSSIDVEGVDLGERGWGTWLANQAAALGGCEDAFSKLLGDLDDVLERSAGLSSFLGQIQPVGKDLRSGRGAGAVRLMSISSSKGLTVRAALIMGAEEGVIPLATGNPDEERRLLYVAMTRPTQFLYLTWARRRTGPTARTGAPRVWARRSRSSLLTHGPINSEPGSAYLRSIDT